MIMVLAIHATGGAEARFIGAVDFTSRDFLAVILNQLARFSVPVFLLLSSYGLTKKYLLKASQDGSSFTVPIAAFYIDRLRKIGVPFLFWTLLFLWVTDRLFPLRWDLMDFFYRRGADYHFYFFHILFEGYLVYPFVAILMQRCGSMARRVLLSVSFIAQIYVTSPSHLLLPESIQLPFLFSAFFIYWQFPFVLGIFLALSPSQSRHSGAIAQGSESPRSMIPAPTGRILQDRRWVWLLIASFIFLTCMMFEYIYWSRRLDQPGDFNHFTRWSVIIYATTVFYMLYLAPGITGKKSNDLIRYLAGLSFSVFIFHTWILRALEVIWGSQPFINLIFLLVIGFGIAAAVERIVSAPVFRTLLALEHANSRSNARIQ